MQNLLVKLDTLESLRDIVAQSNSVNFDTLVQLNNLFQEQATHLGLSAELNLLTSGNQEVAQAVVESACTAIRDEALANAREHFADLNKAQFIMEFQDMIAHDNSVKFATRVTLNDIFQEQAIHFGLSIELNISTTENQTIVDILGQYIELVS